MNSARCSKIRLNLFALGAALSLVAMVNAPAQNGVMTRDSLLMGFHYNQYPHGVPVTEPSTELNYAEYTEFNKEDLPYLSYTDFWVVWSDLERYKGDEKGMAELDAMVNRALTLGTKVKLVMIHSTAWTHDLDWSKPQVLAIGPKNLEDWEHWCEVMARYYRGRVAQWDLQGEANGKDYWPFERKETLEKHVHESYAVGCRAIRRAAPEALVSISCATPGMGAPDIFEQPISRAELDRWYRSNLQACKGLFDAVPINYFADIPGADPYGGGFAFYKSIRSILDELGLTQVELGSGESSVNWAESSYDLKKLGLSIPAQARRLNETLAATFDDGMNKWIWHGIPQPPGLGWVWRWAFRKYEDVWGVWPEANKIPGTRIVWRYDNPDGRKVDYRPAWSRPADPHLPSWEIWKFWAQAMPPGAEAVRMPVKILSPGKQWQLGSYLASRDSAIVLIYSEEHTPVHLRVNTERTGWPEGAALQVAGNCKRISFDTGDAIAVWDQPNIAGRVKNGGVDLSLPASPGWTALRLSRDHPDFDARLVKAILPDSAAANEPVRAQLVVANQGKETWAKGHAIQLRLVPTGDLIQSRPLQASVRPGEAACFELSLPAVADPQQKTWTVRLAQARRGHAPVAFGPAMDLCCRIVDNRRPAKFFANRELHHIRLTWLPPASGKVQHYEIFRGKGLNCAKQLLKTTTSLEYVDAEVQPDSIYEYEVVAVYQDGTRSVASAPDAARALSQPRLWDAEITTQTVPTVLTVGEPQSTTVTIQNTGSKEWDLRPDSGMRVYLQTAQLWEQRDEGRLPQISLGEPRVIAPGETVTVTFPYAGRSPGCFENHWSMRLEAKAGRGAWFGTPLRVQTRVSERASQKP